MELPIYQIDAFTADIFGGNPAAVVPLQEWLPDDVMQNIAIENNLSETAFFIPDGKDFHLRWFTPTYEIDLCGHATLATSHVILRELHPEKDSVTFKTNVAGELIVTKQKDGLEMDFPSRPGKRIDIEDIPDIVIEGIGGVKPIEAYKARDLMLVFEDQNTVTKMQPDFAKLFEYPNAVIVTTETNDPKFDFISRFLCAYDYTLPEDPVTGSAHCTLIPYWADKLGKNELSAYQASTRGGHLQCKLDGDRVFIKGQTKLYLKGTIHV